MRGRIFQNNWTSHPLYELFIPHSQLPELAGRFIAYHRPATPCPCSGRRAAYFSLSAESGWRHQLTPSLLRKLSLINAKLTAAGCSRNCCHMSRTVLCAFGNGNRQSIFVK